MLSGSTTHDGERPVLKIDLRSRQAHYYFNGLDTSAGYQETVDGKNGRPLHRLITSLTGGKDWEGEIEKSSLIDGIQ